MVEEHRLPPSYPGRQECLSRALTLFFTDAPSGNRRLRFTFRDADGTQAVLCAYVDFELDTWHHVAITIDRDGYAIFYFDGEQAGNPISLAAATQDDVSSSNNAYIGAASLDDTNFIYEVDGSIDDVRIYHEALTDDDIEALYTSSASLLVETSAVEYAYDYANRMVARTEDVDGDGVEDPTTEYFVYDDNQIVLTFTDDGAGAELTSRYLWGPQVDQLLAEERYVDGETGHEDPSTDEGFVYWAVCDQLGSVQDLVQYDDQTGATSVVGHFVYDSFGNRVQADGVVEHGHPLHRPVVRLALWHPVQPQPLVRPRHRRLAHPRPPLLRRRRPQPLPLRQQQLDECD